MHEGVSLGSSSNKNNCSAISMATSEPVEGYSPLTPGCSLFGPESLILNNILPVYLKVLGEGKGEGEDEGEGLKGNTFLAWLFHSLNKYLLGAYYMQYASIVWLLWIQSE